MGSNRIACKRMIQNRIIIHTNVYGLYVDYGKIEKTENPMDLQIDFHQPAPEDADFMKHNQPQPGKRGMGIDWWSVITAAGAVLLIKLGVLARIPW
jgi:hypothetical protein